MASLRQLAAGGSVRRRSIARAAAAMGAARLAGLLNILLGIPLALHALGPVEFGVFATITAISAMAGVADFGIGNSLLTPVAAAHARDDQLDIQRQLSNGFVVVAVIGVVLSLATVGATEANWFALALNAPDDLALRESGVIVAVTSFLCLPFQLSSKVQMATQRGGTAGLWQTAGSVIGLLGLLVAAALSAPLEAFVAAQLGGPAIAGILAAARDWTTRSHLRVRRELLDRAVMRRIVATGGMLFTINIAALAAMQTDVIIVAQTYGPDAVAQYSAPQRVLLLMPSVLSLVLMPLWPAYAEALARDDYPWLQHTYRRTLIAAALIVAVPTITLAWSADIWLPAWTGDKLRPDFALMFALAGWAFTAALGGPTAMVLNGIGAFRFLTLTSTAFVFVNVPLAIIFAKAFGLAGVPLASAACQLLVIQLPAQIYLRRYFAKCRAASHPPTSCRAQ